MALSREISFGTGLATAALVWGIYNSALPSIADARVTPAHDKDLAGTERAASWMAAAAVAGVSLIARDATVFVLGGSMVVALAWWHRHANHYDMATGRVAGGNRAPFATSNGMTEASGYMPAVG